MKYNPLSTSIVNNSLFRKNGSGGNTSSTGEEIFPRELLMDYHGFNIKTNEDNTHYIENLGTLKEKANLYSGRGIKLLRGKEIATPTVLTNQTTILTTIKIGDTIPSLATILNSNGNLSLSINNNSIYLRSAAGYTTTSVTANTVYSIAITISGTNAILYVNAKAVSNIQLNTINSNPLVIGDKAAYLNGDIIMSDLMVFETLLNTTDIKNYKNNINDFITRTKKGNLTSSYVDASKLTGFYPLTENKEYVLNYVNPVEQELGQYSGTISNDGLMDELIPEANTVYRIEVEVTKVTTPVDLKVTNMNGKIDLLTGVTEVGIFNGYVYAKDTTSMPLKLQNASGATIKYKVFKTNHPYISDYISDCRELARELNWGLQTAHMYLGDTTGEYRYHKPNTYMARSTYIEYDTKDDLLITDSEMYNIEIFMRANNKHIQNHQMMTFNGSTGLYMTPDNRVHLNGVYDNNDVELATPILNVNDKLGWNHYLFVVKEKGSKVIVKSYLNGNLINTNSSIAATNRKDLDVTRILSSIENVGYEVKEFRVYKGESLIPAEVKINYRSSINGIPTPLRDMEEITRPRELIVDLHNFTPKIDDTGNRYIENKGSYKPNLMVSGGQALNLEYMSAELKLGQDKTFRTLNFIYGLARDGMICRFLTNVELHIVNNKFLIKYDGNSIDTGLESFKKAVIITITYNGSDLYVYVDGTASSKITITGKSDSTITIKSGVFSHLTLCNVVLSQAQINRVVEYPELLSYVSKLKVESDIIDTNNITAYYPLTEGFNHIVQYVGLELVDLFSSPETSVLSSFIHTVKSHSIISDGNDIMLQVDTPKNGGIYVVVLDIKEGKKISINRVSTDNAVTYPTRKISGEGINGYVFPADSRDSLITITNSDRLDIGIEIYHIETEYINGSGLRFYPNQLTYGLMLDKYRHFDGIVYDFNKNNIDITYPKKYQFESPIELNKIKEWTVELYVKLDKSRTESAVLPIDTTGGIVYINNKLNISARYSASPAVDKTLNYDDTKPVHIVMTVKEKDDKLYTSYYINGEMVEYIVSDILYNSKITIDDIFRTGSQDSRYIVKELRIYRGAILDANEVGINYRSSIENQSTTVAEKITPYNRKLLLNLTKWKTIKPETGAINTIKNTAGTSAKVDAPRGVVRKIKQGSYVSLSVRNFLSDDHTKTITILHYVVTPTTTIFDSYPITAKYELEGSDKVIGWYNGNTKIGSTKIILYTTTTMTYVQRNGTATLYVDGDKLADLSGFNRETAMSSATNLRGINNNSIYYASSYVVFSLALTSKQVKDLYKDFSGFVYMTDGGFASQYLKDPMVVCFIPMCEKNSFLRDYAAIKVTRDRLVYGPGNLTYASNGSDVSVSYNGNKLFARINNSNSNSVHYVRFGLYISGPSDLTPRIARFKIDYDGPISILREHGRSGEFMVTSNLEVNEYNDGVREFLLRSSTDTYRIGLDIRVADGRILPRTPLTLEYLGNYDRGDTFNPIDDVNSTPSLRPSEGFGEFRYVRTNDNVLVRTDPDAIVLQNKLDQYNLKNPIDMLQNNAYSLEMFIKAPDNVKVNILGIEGDDYAFTIDNRKLIFRDRIAGINALRSHTIQLPNEYVHVIYTMNIDDNTVVFNRYINGRELGTIEVPLTDPKAEVTNIKKLFNNIYQIDTQKPVFVKLFKIYTGTVLDKEEVLNHYSTCKLSTLENQRPKDKRLLVNFSKMKFKYDNGRTVFTSDLNSDYVARSIANTGLYLRASNGSENTLSLPDYMSKSYSLLCLVKIATINDTKILKIGKHLFIADTKKIKVNTNGTVKEYDYDTGTITIGIVFDGNETKVYFNGQYFDKIPANDIDGKIQLVSTTQVYYSSLIYTTELLTDANFERYNNSPYEFVTISNGIVKSNNIDANKVKYMPMLSFIKGNLVQIFDNTRLGQPTSLTKSEYNNNIIGSNYTSAILGDVLNVNSVGNGYYELTMPESRFRGVSGFFIIEYLGAKLRTPGNDYYGKHIVSIKRGSDEYEFLGNNYADTVLIPFPKSTDTNLLKIKGRFNRSGYSVKLKISYLETDKYITTKYPTSPFYAIDIGYPLSSIKRDSDGLIVSTSNDKLKAIKNRPLIMEPAVSLYGDIGYSIEFRGDFTSSIMNASTPSYTSLISGVNDVGICVKNNYIELIFSFNQVFKFKIPDDCIYKYCHYLVTLSQVDGHRECKLYMNGKLAHEVIEDNMTEDIDVDIRTIGNLRVYGSDSNPVYQSVKIYRGVLNTNEVLEAYLLSNRENIIKQVTRELLVDYTGWEHNPDNLELINKGIENVKARPSLSSFNTKSNVVTPHMDLESRTNFITDYTVSYFAYLDSSKNFNGYYAFSYYGTSVMYEVSGSNVYLKIQFDTLSPTTGLLGPINNLYHIVMVRKETILSIYSNGSLVFNCELVPCIYDADRSQTKLDVYNPGALGRFFMLRKSLTPDLVSELFKDPVNFLYLTKGGYKSKFKDIASHVASFIPMNEEHTAFIDYNVDRMGTINPLSELIKVTSPTYPSGITGTIEIDDSTNKLRIKLSDKFTSGVVSVLLGQIKYAVLSLTIPDFDATLQAKYLPNAPIIKIESLDNHNGLFVLPISDISGAAYILAIAPTNTDIIELEFVSRLSRDVTRHYYGKYEIAYKNFKYPMHGYNINKHGMLEDYMPGSYNIRDKSGLVFDNPIDISKKDSFTVEMYIQTPNKEELLTILGSDTYPLKFHNRIADIAVNESSAPDNIVFDKVEENGFIHIMYGMDVLGNTITYRSYVNGEKQGEKKIDLEAIDIRKFYVKSLFELDYGNTISLENLRVRDFRIYAGEVFTDNEARFHYASAKLALKELEDKEYNGPLIKVVDPEFKTVGDKVYVTNSAGSDIKLTDNHRLVTNLYNNSTRNIPISERLSSDYTVLVKIHSDGYMNGEIYEDGIFEVGDNVFKIHWNGSQSRFILSTYVDNTTRWISRDLGPAGVGLHSLAIRKNGSQVTVFASDKELVTWTYTHNYVNRNKGYDPNRLVMGTPVATMGELITIDEPLSNAKILTLIADIDNVVDLEDGKIIKGKYDIPLNKTKLYTASNKTDNTLVGMSIDEQPKAVEDILASKVLSNVTVTTGIAPTVVDNTLKFKFSSDDELTLELGNAVNGREGLVLVTIEKMHNLLTDTLSAGEFIMVDRIDSTVYHTGYGRYIIPGETFIMGVNMTNNYNRMNIADYIRDVIIMKCSSQTGAELSLSFKFIPTNRFLNMYRAGTLAPKVQVKVGRAISSVTLGSNGLVQNFKNKRLKIGRFAGVELSDVAQLTESGYHIGFSTDITNGVYDNVYIARFIRGGGVKFMRDKFIIHLSPNTKIYINNVDLPKGLLYIAINVSQVDKMTYLRVYVNARLVRELDITDDDTIANDVYEIASRSNYLDQYNGNAIDIDYLEINNEEMPYSVIERNYQILLSKIDRSDRKLMIDYDWSLE